MLADFWLIVLVAWLGIVDFRFGLVRVLYLVVLRLVLLVSLFAGCLRYVGFVFCCWFCWLRWC